MAKAPVLGGPAANPLKPPTSPMMMDAMSRSSQQVTPLPKPQKKAKKKPFGR